MNSLKEFMGFPESLIDVYKQEFNITQMFPWQVECLTHREEVVREKANLIYSAPTSAGKTLVSELIMLRNIIREPAKKALIVMPYVSLITEKEMKLKNLDKLRNRITGLISYKGDLFEREVLSFYPMFIHN